MIAVATHKYVISFCVGLELFNANTPKHLYATYIIVFSVMSMVGIAIGTTLTSGVAEESVPYAAMVGILQVRWIQWKFTENTFESFLLHNNVVTPHSKTYYELVQILGTSRRNNSIRVRVRNTWERKEQEKCVGNAAAALRYFRCRFLVDYRNTR